MLRLVSRSQLSFASRVAAPATAVSANVHRRLAASATGSSTPTGASSNATSAAAAADDVLSASPKVAVSQMASSKAVRIMNRELLDEQIRPERPTEPVVPRGWKVHQKLGSGEFWVTRMYENEVGTLEELRLRCGIDIKDPEKTYRQDDGEREEPEHFNFNLFISKPKAGAKVGGLEFMLTSVDAELVLDGMAVHSTYEDLQIAMTRSAKCIADTNLRYRGPYINELDEDFADELMNYLDDRGVHNTFAEFIQQQAHVSEQLEYEHFLKIVRAFASAPKKKQTP